MMLVLRISSLAFNDSRRLTLESALKILIWMLERNAKAPTNMLSVCYVCTVVYCGTAGCRRKKFYGFWWWRLGSRSAEILENITASLQHHQSQVKIISKLQHLSMWLGPTLSPFLIYTLRIPACLLLLSFFFLLPVGNKTLPTHFEDVSYQAHISKTIIFKSLEIKSLDLSPYFNNKIADKWKSPMNI